MRIFRQIVALSLCLSLLAPDAAQASSSPVPAAVPLTPFQLHLSEQALTHRATLFFAHLPLWKASFRSHTIRPLGNWARQTISSPDAAFTVVTNSVIAMGGAALLWQLWFGQVSWLELAFNLVGMAAAGPALGWLRKGAEVQDVRSKLIGKVKEVALTMKGILVEVHFLIGGPSHYTAEELNFLWPVEPARVSGQINGRRGGFSWPRSRHMLDSDGRLFWKLLRADDRLYDRRAGQLTKAASNVIWAILTGDTRAIWADLATGTGTVQQPNPQRLRTFLNFLPERVHLLDFLNIYRTIDSAAYQRLSDYRLALDAILKMEEMVREQKGRKIWTVGSKLSSIVLLLVMLLSSRWGVGYSQEAQTGSSLGRVIRQQVVRPITDAAAVHHNLRQLASLPNRQLGSPNQLRAYHFIRNSLVTAGYDHDRLHTAEIGPDLPVYLMALPPDFHPDKPTILVLAHFDGLIGPGADDNGSGAAAVLELARVFAGRHSRENVVFLFTGDEETNKLGGRMALMRLHRLGVSLRSIRALDIDSIGQSILKDPKLTGDRTARLVITPIKKRGGPDPEPWWDALKPQIEKVSLRYVLDPPSEVYAGWDGVKDVAPLVSQYDIQGIGVSSIRHDQSNPFWHTKDDGLDHVDLDAVARATEALACGIEALAGPAHSGSESPRPARPLAVPLTPLENHLPEMQALFQRFGIEFVTRTDMPIRKDEVRAMELWLQDLQERWPNFREHFKGLVYDPATRDFRPPKPGYVVYPIPLSWPVGQYFFNFMDPESKVTHLPREQFLTFMIVSRIKTSAYAAENIPAIDGSPANAVALPMQDFVSVFYTGKVTSLIFLARDRTTNPPVPVVAGAQEEREAYIAKVMKERGARFTKPYPNSFDLRVEVGPPSSSNPSSGSRPYTGPPKNLLTAIGALLASWAMTLLPLYRIMPIQGDSASFVTVVSSIFLLSAFFLMTAYHGRDIRELWGYGQAKGGWHRLVGASSRGGVSPELQDTALASRLANHEHAVHMISRELREQLRGRLLNLQQRFGSRNLLLGLAIEAGFALTDLVEFTLGLGEDLVLAPWLDPVINSQNELRLSIATLWDQASVRLLGPHLSSIALPHSLPPMLATIDEDLHVNQERRLIVASRRRWPDQYADPLLRIRQQIREMPIVELEREFTRRVGRSVLKQTKTLPDLLIRSCESLIRVSPNEVPDLDHLWLWEAAARLSHMVVPRYTGEDALAVWLGQITGAVPTVASSDPMAPHPKTLELGHRAGLLYAETKHYFGPAESLGLVAFQWLFTGARRRWQGFVQLLGRSLLPTLAAIIAASITGAGLGPVLVVIVLNALANAQSRFPVYRMEHFLNHLLIGAGLAFMARFLSIATPNVLVTASILVLLIMIIRWTQDRQFTLERLDRLEREVAGLADLTHAASSPVDLYDVAFQIANEDIPLFIREQGPGESAGQDLDDMETEFRRLFLYTSEGLQANNIRAVDYITPNPVYPAGKRNRYGFDQATTQLKQGILLVSRLEEWSQKRLARQMKATDEELKREIDFNQAEGFRGILRQEGDRATRITSLRRSLEQTLAFIEGTRQAPDAAVSVRQLVESIDLRWKRQGAARRPLNKKIRRKENPLFQAIPTQLVGEVDSFPPPLPEFAFYSILSNLIRNAKAHGTPEAVFKPGTNELLGWDVPVGVKVRLDGQTPVLEVENPGKIPSVFFERNRYTNRWLLFELGVTQAKRMLVNDPEEETTPTDSENETSSSGYNQGIGLAVIYHLCKIYGLDPDVMNVDGNVRMSIRFPEGQSVSQIPRTWLARVMHILKAVKRLWNELKPSTKPVGIGPRLQESEEYTRLSSPAKTVKALSEQLEMTKRAERIMLSVFTSAIDVVLQGPEEKESEAHFLDRVQQVALAHWRAEAALEVAKVDSTKLESLWRDQSTSLRQLTMTKCQTLSTHLSRFEDFGLFNPRTPLGPFLERGYLVSPPSGLERVTALINRLESAIAQEYQPTHPWHDLLTDIDAIATSEIDAIVRDTYLSDSTLASARQTWALGLEYLNQILSDRFDGYSERKRRLRLYAQLDSDLIGTTLRRHFEKITERYLETATVVASRPDQTDLVIEYLDEIAKPLLEAARRGPLVGELPGDYAVRLIKAVNELAEEWGAYVLDDVRWNSDRITPVWQRIAQDIRNTLQEQATQPSDSRESFVQDKNVSLQVFNPRLARPFGPPANGPTSTPSTADLLAPLHMAERVGTSGRAFYYGLVGVWEELVFRWGALSWWPTFFDSHGGSWLGGLGIGLGVSVVVFTFLHPVFRWAILAMRGSGSWSVTGLVKEIRSEMRTIRHDFLHSHAFPALLYTVLFVAFQTMASYDAFSVWQYVAVIHAVVDFALGPFRSQKALERSAAYEEALLKTHRDDTRPSTVPEYLGAMLRPVKTPMAFAFIDLDDMRQFNRVVGKRTVDTHFRNKLIELLDDQFPERWGFAGGDEIFIVAEGDPDETREKLEFCRIAFKNPQLRSDATPSEVIPRMTLSIGVVTVEQITEQDPEFFARQPRDRFYRAKALASEALKEAKDRLGKDAIADYQPTPLVIQLWRGVKSWWSGRQKNPLDPATRRTMPHLYDRGALQKPVRLDEIEIDPSLVRQLENEAELRDHLKNYVSQNPNQPVLTGSFRPRYRGRLLARLAEAISSRTYGLWHGFKIFNIFDTTYTAGDRVAAATREVFTLELARAFLALPPEWQGEIWVARSIPDGMTFVIVPKEEAAADALTQASVMDNVHRALNNALSESRDRLTGGEYVKEGHTATSVLRRGLQVHLQGVARVAALDHSALVGPMIMAPLDDGHLWLAHQLPNQMSPVQAQTQEVLFIGVQESLSQEATDVVSDIRVKEREEAWADLRKRVRKDVQIEFDPALALSHYRTYEEPMTMNGETVGEVLHHLQAHYPELAQRFLDHRSQLLLGVSLSLNQKPLTHRIYQQTLRSGDTLTIRLSTDYTIPRQDPMVDVPNGSSQTPQTVHRGILVGA